MGRGCGFFCYGALSCSNFSFLWLILRLILWLSSYYVAQSESQNFLIDFHLEIRMALFFGSKWALLRFLRFLEYDFWIQHPRISLRANFQVNWNGSFFWLQMSSFGFLSMIFGLSILELVSKVIFSSIRMALFFGS